MPPPPSSSTSTRRETFLSFQPPAIGEAELQLLGPSFAAERVLDRLLVGDEGGQRLGVEAEAALAGERRLLAAKRCPKGHVEAALLVEVEGEVDLGATGEGELADAELAARALAEGELTGGAVALGLEELGVAGRQGRGRGEEDRRLVARALDRDRPAGDLEDAELGRLGEEEAGEGRRAAGDRIAGEPAELG